MLKVKQHHTADCVVGGFRYGTGSREVGSLLLGLYDDAGKLDHVGFTSTISSRERQAVTKRLEALISPPGFTGKAPGGPSRWSTERSGEWQPLKPKLVVEVQYDQITGDRFRHGTKLIRWRPISGRSNAPSTSSPGKSGLTDLLPRSSRREKERQTRPRGDVVRNGRRSAQLGLAGHVHGGDLGVDRWKDNFASLAAISWQIHVYGTAKAGWPPGAPFMTCPRTVSTGNRSMGPPDWPAMTPASVQT